MAPGGIRWPLGERRRFPSWDDVCRLLHRTRRPFVDCNRGRRRTVLVNVADKAKSAFVQRADEALVVAAVAERPPCCADAGAQRRLRDDAALPNHVDQFVLADDPIAVANQVNEQIEHLRLDVNGRAGASQLLPRDVDVEIGEAEIQSSPLIIALPRQSLGRPQAATCQIVGGYSGCTIPLRPLSQRFSDLWLRSRFYKRSRRSACASANIRKKRANAAIA